MSTSTADYEAADRRFLWHPYTRSSSLDEGLPVITRGEGVHLYDTEGRRYFDAVASWWCCNLGHGHPRVVRAIQEQAARLQHSILGNLSHPPAIELAARIVELLGGDRRVFFASDGASAVEAALKIVLQYWHNTGRPERHRFASLRNGYHGDTLGAVSIGYIPGFHAPFRPSLFPVHQADAPSCSDCAAGADPGRCGLACFASMERILAEHGHELAAVVVEPLCQGAGGMKMYSPRYLERLAGACREREVLLVVDEIAMGFGRTGRMFAHEHAGIDPDIVCLGKGLSGGYLPISATVVREGIFRTFTDRPEDHTFYHGHTFAGNPIAAAASLEVLRVYREEGIVERAAEGGRLLRAELEELRGERFVAGVRSLGLIGVVELGDAPDGRSGAALAQAVRRGLLGRGILLRPLGNVVYLFPPLVTPGEVLADAVRQLRAVIRAL
jgi:adenosylmethionine-8-amino-7-oxononanoate aminotransferase